MTLIFQKTPIKINLSEKNPSKLKLLKRKAVINIRKIIRKFK